MQRMQRNCVNHRRNKKIIRRIEKENTYKRKAGISAAGVLRKITH